MTKNKVVANPQAQLLEGVNIVADAVEATLGAAGLAVGIAKTTQQGEIYDRSIVVDGVSVASAINLTDEALNFGAQVVIEAARRQRDTVGDGTSVTIALARAIMQHAAPIIAAGTNPQLLRPGLEAGVDKLIAELKKVSQPVTKIDELIKVATISAKDVELGKLIGTTIHKLGVDATVTAEESKSTETSVDHQEGMQLDHGYYHEYFITNPERMEATLTMPAILITDLPITSLLPLAAMLNEFVKKEKKLVIISPDISLEPMGRLIEQKIKGALLPLCIKAPSFGKNQKDILQDIATLTGATYISEQAGMTLDQVTTQDLGRCESITATQRDTIIAGGRGKKRDIAERTALIKAELQHPETEFDRLKHEERLGKLTNGIAIIHVGGYTEIEMKERRERVIDGIAATKAAMREGIVPGGEIVYLNIRRELHREDLAERILYKALEQPFKRLVENAGQDGGSLLVMASGGDGFNVITGKMEDMLDAGIIDPTAVPLNALQNALSVAIQLLSTKYLIIPDDSVSQLQQK